MNLTKLDYYTALDISPDATREAIEAAHQDAVDNYSPDSMATYGLLTDDERREILRFLEEARRTLCDDDVRARYDRELKDAGRYPERRMRAVPTPPPAMRIAEPPAESPAPLSAAPEPAERAVPDAPEARPTGESTSRPLPPAAERVVERKPEPPVTQPPVPDLSALPELDGRPFGGAELRAIREAHGLSIREVSTRTKVSSSNLTWIEESNFALLPAPVYLKGFLRLYAKLLRIDENKVVSDYMRNFEAYRQG